jgi:hypothetical protein
MSSEAEDDVGDPKDPERRYLEVEMPDRFVLEFQRPDGDWMDEAFCSPGTSSATTTAPIYVGTVGQASGSAPSTSTQTA